MTIPFMLPPLRSKRARITFALIGVLLISGLSTAARGTGAFTRIVRLWNPSYRVPLFPAKVIGCSPEDGARSVPTSAVPAIDLKCPQGMLDEQTLGGNIWLIRTGDQKPIATRLSSSGTRIVLKPAQPLDEDTNYTILLTSGVKDVHGVGVTPAIMSFTTVARADPSIRFEKIPLPISSGVGCTAVQIGPDHKLYAAADDG